MRSGPDVKLAIMQGRLVPPEPQRFQSFPRSRWRDEFAIAAAAGLDAIEWIYDAYGEAVNPLSSEPGMAEMQSLCRAHGVAVQSVCADWFMDFPLAPADAIDAAPRWERLEWLMERCGRLGMKRIVLPFVDASSMRHAAQKEAVVRGLLKASRSIDSTGVELHLETDLGPEDFAALLTRVPHLGIKVNYDSGNSASLGYAPQAEFAAYGARVGSVHIKDRVAGGGTVPLGEGDADFAALFDALGRCGYRGDFVLQVARGTEGAELEWARHNAQAARRMMRGVNSR
ncbi:MAG TPA: sugar phosphate isomerase/epimerase family protein [Steroidobacteraceae bacterium]|jgi:hexulose-6-phosphate isomerase|nr:sugar phosphate isomerase/epimerase family protein [Steroidobacteraceae bacterium]